MKRIFPVLLFLACASTCVHFFNKAHLINLFRPAPPAPSVFTAVAPTREAGWGGVTVVQVPLEPKSAAPAEEPEPFRSLRRKMKERGLEWLIFCMTEGHYAGWVTKTGESFAKPVEEGGKPGWDLAAASNGNGYPTREAVAKALYKVIDGPYTIFPEHLDHSKPHRNCKPDVGSDEPYRKEGCK